MAISKIGVQATGFADANIGLPIPNISLENRAAEAANGTIFFNTSNNAIEVYANGAWSGIGSSVVGPSITDVTGTIDSGNTGSKISIIGLNFDTDNALLQGTLRFNYNGVSDVTVTPNTSTAINDVTIPSAVLNQAASTSGTIQFIRSDSKLSNAFQKNMSANVFFSVQYVVVAGGGAGGHGEPSNWSGGGGGAGGYRSSVSGESSGGGASAEPALTLQSSTTYTVTIGAGGTGSPASGFVSGSNSVFSSITSLGGGGGGGVFGGNGYPAGSGGSGGGHYGTGSGFGQGTPGQGFAGAGGGGSFSSNESGGGGGASEAGDTDGVGHGGDGVTTAISGTPVTYAGGGGGGGPGTRTGGTGGGADGRGSGSAGNNATPNTGGGGGGILYGPQAGGNGGSGIIILKYPNTVGISNPGGGLTFTTSPSVPGYNVTTFTAGTGSVSWSAN